MDRVDLPGLGADDATLVELRGVHKRYRQGRVEVPALAGVDLDVGPREMLAICGPSGSGKSTLLNIVGLLDEPDAGSVRVGGAALAELDARARARLRARAVGFVFQSFNLVPVLSALENVLLPLALQGRADRAGRRRAQALLDAVGLGARARAYPDRLSGGQRQRVAIARALVTEPRLVVADEPTANLDTATSRVVMALIQALRERLGTTFVFSTHDDRILPFMSRIVQLRDGRALDDAAARFPILGPHA